MTASAVILCALTLEEMLFGNREQFGIETFVDRIDCIKESISMRNRILGRVCFWALGEQIGDIEEKNCLLNTTSEQLSHSLRTMDRFNKQDPYCFGSRSDQEIFELVWDDICGEGERRRECDFDHCVHLLFSEDGDSFRDVRTFFVRKTDHILFIAYDWNTESGRRFRVPIELFLDSISTFLEYIDSKSGIASNK